MLGFWCCSFKAEEWCVRECGLVLSNHGYESELASSFLSALISCAIWSKSRRFFLLILLIYLWIWRYLTRLYAQKARHRWQAENMEEEAKVSAYCLFFICLNISHLSLSLIVLISFDYLSGFWVLGAYSLKNTQKVYRNAAFNRIVYEYTFSNW